MTRRPVEAAYFDRLGRAIEAARQIDGQVITEAGRITVELTVEAAEQLVLALRDSTPSAMVQAPTTKGTP